MREHESLRKALAWLLEQEQITAERIAEALNHFDLSPLDEDFLRHYFAKYPREPQPDQIKNTQSDDFKGN
ncbi:hypothetical protein [Zobellella maritima]|uniref:hypothetical protein n=1 Tax=Zobellella maritima TaxID=2059725 RepID=UPI000E303B2A|nr:hypothetical protein [Zobellella maritima]